jgi:hypothetical protein
MRARALIGTLAVLTAASVAFGTPDPGKAVRGQALRELFADHEFADDVHFTYRFRADGTFAGTEMAKDVRGTWRVSGLEICWTWTRPRGAEECYAVRKNGAEISLFRNGVEQWYGTLKPLQPGKPQ